MPLILVGFLSLGLGAIALSTGRLPVTRKRAWRGRRAKVVGCICFGFGLLCVGAWAWLMFDKYVFSAR
jgi:hypothetical protein